MGVIFVNAAVVNRIVLVPQNCVMVERKLWKYCFRISLLLSSFNLCFTFSFLNPGLTLSNSVQLEMPYLVCPNGLIRVLSETPPPFLSPPEVRASAFSPPTPPEHLLPTQQPAALPHSLSPLYPLSLWFAVDS